MKLQKTTQRFYPPVHNSTKRSYLERVAEEQEADKEIKEYEPETYPVSNEYGLRNRQSSM